VNSTDPSGLSACYAITCDDMPRLFAYFNSSGGSGGNAGPSLPAGNWGPGSWFQSAFRLDYGGPDALSANFRQLANERASSIPSWQEMHQGIESTFDKTMRCGSAQLGLDDLAAAGAAVSGFNILKTRGKFAGATPGTSIASRGASAVFGQTRLPFRVPTAVGNPLTLKMRIRATSSVARVVGRGIPFVGWGLLVYDAFKILQCVATDD
jgi:hypothetical protein